MSNWLIVGRNNSGTGTVHYHAGMQNWEMNPKKSYHTTIILDKRLLKSLAINYDKLLKHYRTDKDCVLIRELVNHSFQWFTTPQGRNWWEAKYNKDQWEPDDLVIFYKILLLSVRDTTDYRSDDRYYWNLICRIKRLLGEEYCE